MLIKAPVISFVKETVAETVAAKCLIDEDLLSAAKEGDGLKYRLWEPTLPLVVLGRSSRPQEEIKEEACRRDGIAVIKRQGGGQSVLLSSGMLVISVAASTPFFRGHLHYPRAINNLVEKSLRALGVRDLYHCGVSDLVIHDRKILGCCLFVTQARGKWVFFYQGSLLLDPDLGLMDRYLNHPPREPAYRRGRSHREFLTSLRAEGYHLRVVEVSSRLATLLEQAEADLL